MAVDDESRRQRYSLIVLLGMLVVCDMWLFRSTGLARFLSAAAAYAGLFAAYKYSRLNLSDIGLARSAWKHGVRVSLAVVAIIPVILTGAYLFDSSLFHDPRYHQSVIAAIIAALIVLPLKTVIFEELVFRGVLFALLCKLSNKKYALLGSSVLFGLWHLPTAGGINGGLQNNQVTLPSYSTLLVVFFVTTLAGLVLGYLRYKSNSLLTSIAAHWAINASAIILAALSWR